MKPHHSNLIGCAVLLLLVVYNAVQLSRYHRLARHYASVQATVTHSGTRSSFSYRFPLGERSYSGSMSDDGRVLRPGTPITVYYAPENPSFSTTHFPPDYWSKYLIFLLVTSGVLVWCLVRVIRAPRLAEPS